jgi:peptidoglycan/LPS O-acetylase OafA/YrhL
MARSTFEDASMEGWDRPRAEALADAGRLRHVDALRGIAALLVVWLHVANLSRTLSPRGHGLDDFAASLDVGRIGVVVFFLISGYVIPFSMRPSSPAPIGAFAIRRVFRIYPAYWLSVPLAAYAFYWSAGAAFPAGELLANLTLLQSAFGLRHAEGVYWTLVVEVAFYALCVALLLTRSLFDARRLALLAAAFALAHVFAMFMLWLGRPIVSIPTAFWPLNLSVMLWGALYRLDIEGKCDRFSSTLLRALGVLFVVALPVGASLATDSRVIYATAYAIAFVVFLAGMRFVRIETKLTDWLGRISYSIYLFHPIVFEPIYVWLLGKPADSPWRTQHSVVYLSVTLVLTLAVASLVYRYVEAPSIRLGHRLASAWEKRAARSQTLPAPAAAPVIVEAPAG